MKAFERNSIKHLLLVPLWVGGMLAQPLLSDNSDSWPDMMTRLIGVIAYIAGLFSSRLEKRRRTHGGGHNTKIAAASPAYQQIAFFCD